MQNRRFSIIGGAILSDGAIAAVATNWVENRLYRFDGLQWELQHSWRGKEVLACCAVGDGLVCSTVDSEVYIVRGSAVETVRLPEDYQWMSGACQLDESTALVAGQSGRFAAVRADGHVDCKRMGRYGVPKPGRAVEALVTTSRGIFFLGSRNLLLRYDPDRDQMTDLVGDSLRGREMFFYDLVETPTGPWCTGIEGAQLKLIGIREPGLEILDTPLQGTSTPTLAFDGANLIIASHKILIGQPNEWKSCADLKADSVIQFVANSAFGICALSARGKSYFQENHSWRRVPIFVAF